MKILRAILPISLALLMGCAGVSRQGDTCQPQPLSGGDVSSACLTPKRVPPRIARWLARAKVDFQRIEESSGSYRLTLETTDGMTADRREYIPEYFRGRVAESFAKANALDPRRITVAILSEQMDDHVYRGEASAFGVDDIEMSYDSVTRLGRLAMKVRGGDFDGTRALIRSRIEAIVRDKNICLVAGVTPPPGRYYLLGETVKPGNALEIEFKSE